MKRGENMSAIIRDKKYVTWDEKPVFAADYESAPDSLKQTPTLAIVMQGPLKLEENFTRETLKIYQKNFPDCPIVLSTWKTENADEIKKIEDLGVKVLLNSPPPPYKGLWNVNNQILSTRNGLARAKETGAEYVIKTRTDQRFYETNIPEFLFNILKTFPVYDRGAQKSRLVTFSMNTFKYRLYDISDMFLFGHIDDVIKFWSCEFEQRTDFPPHQNLLEYSELRPSEIYFTTEYLKKLGHDCKYTLRDSWLAYGRYFCVVDSVSVGLYWPKYSNIVNRWRNFFGAFPELEELTFKEWLNIYAGLDNKNVPEHFITDGLPQKSGLFFNENLLGGAVFGILKILKRIRKFIFYKKENAKGFLIVKVLGVRIIKIKTKRGKK